MSQLVASDLESLESTDTAEPSVQPIVLAAGDVRDCARTYLRLLERWTGSVAP